MEKPRCDESEEKGRSEEIRERVRRKKMQVREKARKSRYVTIHCYCSNLWLRRVDRESGAIWPDERWKIARRCGAKHISKSKCAKHTILGPHLGSWDVEKVHAVVARSTFPSQNVQNTPFSDHFWMFRCPKSARRCGAKSKCSKLMVRLGATFGRSDVVLRGRRKGSCTLSKVSEPWRFGSSFNYKSAGLPGVSCGSCLFVVVLSV